MTATVVEAAIRDTILAITPSLVPTATLATAAAVGDTTLTVGTGQTARFPAAGLVLFADGAGERRIRIGSVADPVLTLDTSGMGQTGLAFAHAAGTTIYANLVTGMGIQYAPMLALGDPVFSITTLREDLYRYTQPHGYVAVYSMHIAYSVQLLPVAGDTVDANVWALEQQDRAKTTLHTVQTALQHNYSLITQTATAAVLDIGMPGAGGQGTPEFTTDWTQLIGDLDTYQFTAALNVIYYGDPAKPS